MVRGADKRKKYRQVKQIGGRGYEQVRIRGHGGLPDLLTSSETMLEIRGGVDLCWGVITLEGALEGRPAVHGVARIRLLSAGSAGVIHQVVVLLGGLLPSPDPPSHKRQAAKNDGAADTDHDTNNNITGVGRHAGLSATSIVVGQARGLRGCQFAGDGCRLPIATSSSDECSARLDDKRSRGS